MKQTPIEDIETRYDADILRARTECALAINDGLNRKWAWLMENKDGSAK